MDLRARMPERVTNRHGARSLAFKIEKWTLSAVRAVVRTVLAARTPRCIMMFDGARAVLKCFYMEYKLYALKFFLIFKNMSYF